jgi:hypothetical protein
MVLHISKILILISQKGLKYVIPKYCNTLWKGINKASKLLDDINQISSTYFFS